MVKYTLFLQYYKIKSITIPQTTPITYNNPNILKFSFTFLFTLNNIKIPIPEPTSKPPIIEPILIIFSKYNFVSITEPAQFGISPTRPDIIGPIIGIFNIKFDSYSSTKKCIIKFSMKVIIIINRNIFNVCFTADFSIPPSSQ